MDYNKIMKLVDMSRIQSRVRIANYHDCKSVQKWMSRSIMDLQFIYVVQGCLLQEDAGGIHKASAEQVLFVEPQQRHDLWVENSDAIITGVHCELAEGSWASGDYRLKTRLSRVSSPRDTAGILQLFKGCAQAHADYGRFSQGRSNKICDAIILQLAEEWNSDSTHHMSRRMQEMITFIRDNLHRSLNRNDLAEAFYVSPEHINYIFKRELQTTTSEVINRERCLCAQKLIIEEGLSVKEASRAVGFNDPLFFSRVFKKFFNIPPSKL